MIDSTTNPSSTLTPAMASKIVDAIRSQIYAALRPAALNGIPFNSAQCERKCICCGLPESEVQHD